MALIVEDGSGLSNANSYATTQEALDYFADRGEIPTIQDSDMILATEFLDTVYGPSYRGMIMTQTQSLLFPRTAFYDKNGRKVEQGTVPLSLKTAEFQAAKLSSEGVILVTGPTAESQLSSFTKSVEGAVSKSESYFAPVSRSQTSFISGYISPLIEGNSFQGTAQRG